MVTTAMRVFLLSRPAHGTLVSVVCTGPVGPVHLTPARTHPDRCRDREVRPLVVRPLVCGRAKSPRSHEAPPEVYDEAPARVEPRLEPVTSHPQALLVLGFPQVRRSVPPGRPARGTFQA